MAFRAPLLGYNTNVRHKGKLYHIQTEDSGVNHPHVMTHLFADGGRIVASRKTSYAEHVGVENLPDVVKKLMQAQHKGMFIALRDGVYDEDDTEAANANATVLSETPPDEAALAASPPQAEEPAGDGLYQETRAASVSDRPSAGSKPPVSIFGSELLSEKSLDEVILSYLASDENDE